MVEIWKEIIGYEGYYQISNNGKIKGVERRIKNSLGIVHTIKAKEKKICLHNRGYHRVFLQRTDIAKTFLLHRLIAIHFIENPKNKKHINHINGIKTDNRIENLEWVTTSENNHHAYDTLLKLPSRRKFSDIQIREMRGLKGVIPNFKIAELYNMDRSHLNQILKRKIYKTVE